MFGLRPGRIGTAGKVGGSNRRPSLALDFLNSGPSGDARLTTNRTGGGATYYDPRGTLQLAAANTQRIDYGPTPVVTNYVRNSTASGVVTGTPGTDPIGWALSASLVAGLTKQIVSAGVTNGISTVDIRYFGTPTATSNFFPSFDSVGGYSVVPGITVNISMYAQLVAGTMPTSFFVANFNNNGNCGLAFAPTGSFIRYSGSAVVPIGNTSVGGPFLNIGTTSGVAVDFTIRVGGIQSEIGVTTASALVPTSVTAAQNQTTNWITDSNFVGGVAPSTLPTGMSVVFNGIGITPTFAFGVEAGAPYMDIIMNGSATGVSFCNIALSSPIAATIGQTWTSSISNRLFAGTMSRVNAPLLTHSVQDAGGVVLGGNGIALTFTGVSTRRSVTETFAQAGQIAQLVPLFQFRNSSTGPINVTFRVTMPQSELSPFASTWVPTSTGPVTVGAVPIGLLVEEGRTNSIRNPRAEGAVVSAAMAVPVAPTLGSAVSGAIGATTYFVTTTYVDGAGGETTASPESTLAVAANSVLTVTSPAGGNNSVSYRVYASTTTGTETLQATVAIGTNWQEPNTGLVAGVAMPGSNTAKDAGTLPPNWQQGNLGTLSRFILGSVTDSGIPCIDIRLVGTTSTTGTDIDFEPTTQIAAATGQAWSLSAFARAIAGSFTNITNTVLVAQEYTAGGVFVTASNTTMAVNGNQIGSQRYTLNATLSGGVTTAFVQPYMKLNFVSGVAIDITLRLGAPQHELGAFATSPILPAIGTPAATQRTVEYMSMPSSGWYNPNAGTVVCGFSTTFVNTVNPSGVFAIKDGTISNQIQAFINPNATTTVNYEIKVSNAFQAGSAALSNVATPGTNKIGIAWTSAGLLEAANGNTPVSYGAITIPPGITKLELGVNNGSLNGHVTLFKFWPRKLSSADFVIQTT